jgi:hypothetical protein
MAKKCDAKHDLIRTALRELKACTDDADNMLIKLGHAIDLDHASTHTLQRRGTEMDQLVQREEAVLALTSSKPPIQLPHQFFWDHEQRMRLRTQQLAEQLRDIQLMLDAPVPAADAQALYRVVGDMVHSLGLVAGRVGASHAAIGEEQLATQRAWQQQNRRIGYGKDDPFAMASPPVASALIAPAIALEPTYARNVGGPSGEWEAEKIAAHTSVMVRRERYYQLQQWSVQMNAQGGAGVGAAGGTAGGFGGGGFASGGFGATAKPAFGAAAGGAFGAAAKPAFGAAAGGAFGAAAKPAFGAAAGGAFGAAAKPVAFGAAAGGAFGAAAKPAFGAAAGGAFGAAAKPAFGAAAGGAFGGGAPAAAAFGAAPAAKGVQFGAGAKPAARRTVKPRRKQNGRRRR